MDQNNYEYGYFLHSAHYEISKVFFCMNHNKFMEKSTNAIIGRASPLDSSMLKKVKDIALETRTAGGVINRSQLISIAAGVGRANKSTLLIDFGGDLVLTEKWAKEVLEKLTIIIIIIIIILLFI